MGTVRVFVCVSRALHKRTLYFPGHRWWGRRVQLLFWRRHSPAFSPAEDPWGEDPRLGAFVPKQMKREVAWGQ